MNVPALITFQKCLQLSMRLGASLAIAAGVLVAATASAGAATTFFGPGQLNPCSAIASPNGRYVLSMQCDGNLVLIAPGNTPAWSSGTAGYRGSVAQMQNDGNLVVYSPGHIARWASNTAGNPHSVLAVQDDGNVVIVAPGNHPVWSTDTSWLSGSVPTPAIPGAPNYPASFDPIRAANWAAANAASDANVSDDPCTEFVSRALSAAGLPDDSQWYSGVRLYDGETDRVSDAWINATVFKELMQSRGWLQAIPLNLADNESAGQSISADGAIANPGDLIYYEWNGVESDQHVHLAMITGFSGRVALVTQQSGSGLYGVNTQWNWSYISNESLIQKYGSQARAYLLHWQ